MYNYPLSLSFKIVALAPQLSVTDASGQEVLYVKQKLFKLKEAIGIFSDRSQTRHLYAINADRIIDFSAKYHFTDSVSGQPLGAIKRQGMRSIFKAEYNVFDANDIERLIIKEDNGWIRVADAVLGEIPIVGMFSGYLFHPSYTMSTLNGQGVMRLTKEPAFFEGKFRLEKLVDGFGDAEEKAMVLSYLLMVLLERSRG
ncbi:MAG: hypothetical protein IT326_09555 [Anaerolineae bacterium]|nr:hypothetical protein [Anaerolineae bacterium]